MVRVTVKELLLRIMTRGRVGVRVKFYFAIVFTQFFAIFT